MHEDVESLSWLSVDEWGLFEEGGLCGNINFVALQALFNTFYIRHPFYGTLQFTIHLRRYPFFSHSIKAFKSKGLHVLWVCAQVAL